MSQETEQDKKAEDSVGMGQAYGIHTDAYEKWVEAKDLELNSTCYRMGRGDNGPDYQGKLLKRSKLKMNRLGQPYYILRFEGGGGSSSPNTLFMECPCRRKRNKTKKRKTPRS